jgi:acyl CoA:acetate/3-ketoacid CoA transferase alpha subunit/acyl CoA:acetate/3-ketoacid CoA transferase beta subunit
MEADNKVLSLHEMIGRYVRPGVSLHLAGGIGGPSAAICEIIRQFHGRSPGFELIQSTITGHAINLVHTGLVRKVVFAAGADISTSGRPSRVMQRAWAEKSVETENWSLASLQQRLLAGALGVGFLPTRSVAGSTMAASNSGAFCESANPFGGETTGLLRALNPDVSIVHGCVADAHGNTVLPVPYGEDIWGPLAAGSVLVTVEKVVPESVTNRFAALVKLPGCAVTALAEAPLGLHPFPLAAPGIPDIAEYDTDTAFLDELHEAFADDARLDAWIAVWVLGCATHQDYLARLGTQRIESLRYVPSKSAGTAEKVSPAPDALPTPEEMVLVAAAREIERCVLASGHRTVLIGAGNRAAAALLAHRKLKERGYRLDIVTGNGQVGYEPGAGALGTQGVASIHGSMMLTDTLTSLGVIIGGARNRCLSVLGAGQIDRHGNTNSTVTGEGQFLVGSGGANDAANAREVLVIVNQSRDRFPGTLPYITCPGGQVTTVVTTMGIFRKDPGGDELRLAACLPDDKLPDLNDRIKRVRDNCGWPVETRDDIEDIPGPSREELELLRQLVSPSGR